MKFEVGDRVKHTEYGFGTVRFVESGFTILPYLVEFDKEHKDLHDGLGKVVCVECKSKHGWWCDDKNLTLVRSLKSDSKAGNRITNIFKHLYGLRKAVRNE